MAPDWVDRYSEFTLARFPFIQIGKLAGTAVGAVLLAASSGLADLIEVQLDLPLGFFEWLVGLFEGIVTRIFAGTPQAPNLSGYAIATDAVPRVGGLATAVSQAFEQTAESGLFDGVWGFVLAVLVVVIMAYALALGVSRLVQ